LNEEAVGGAKIGASAARGMKREAIEFHPARPPLRRLFPVGFLALMFLIIAPKVVADPKPWDVVGLTGGGLLVLGGLWLWFRGRFPGKPTLRVDAEGMTYRRYGRERGLAWSEVAAMPVDFMLERMLFVPKSGGKPIAMHYNMVADDGRAWLMLIEDYWTGPDDDQTVCR
jgi:hypothetical protein